MRSKILLLALLPFIVARVTTGDLQRSGPVNLDHEGERWAERTLKKLSLE